MTEAEIIAAMLAINEQGIERVEVDFSGAGDSGDIDEWRYLDSEGDEVHPNDQATETIKRIGEKIINSHYGYDWYNNEGGRGTLRIDFKEKTWDIEGVQYVEEPNSEEGDLFNILDELKED
jgi:hypothetical protein